MLSAKSAAAGGRPPQTRFRISGTRYVWWAWWKARTEKLNSFVKPTKDSRSGTWVSGQPCRFRSSMRPCRTHGVAVGVDHDLAAQGRRQRLPLEVHWQVRLHFLHSDPVCRGAPVVLGVFQRSGLLERVAEIPRLAQSSMCCQHLAGTIPLMVCVTSNRDRMTSQRGRRRSSHSRHRPSSCTASCAPGPRACPRRSAPADRSPCRR